MSNERERVHAAVVAWVESTPAHLKPTAQMQFGYTQGYVSGHDAATARAREERDRLRGLLAQCMASNLGDRLRGEIEVALGLRDHETPSL